VTVPSTVTQLTVNATTNNAYASVNVQNNKLKVGAVTDVSVLVTAQDGTQKTYVIKATREMDENYVPSTNNYLSSLAPSVGVLYPAFNRDVTNYVIMLDYAVTDISFTATPEDTMWATCTALGGTALTAGKDNAKYVMCTAEDNSVRIYSITVVRRASYTQVTDAAALEGILANINSGNTPVVLDLSTSEIQLLPAAVLNALKNNPKVTLILKTRNGAVTIKGSDVASAAISADYDLTMNASSSYRDSMFENLSDEGSYVFSLHEKGELPFKMTVCVYTTLAGGDVVNVYKYDTENNEFILLAKNVEVGAGGSVAFVTDLGGDFVITPKSIPGAATHYVETSSTNSGVFLTLPLIVGFIIVFLTLGCLGGLMINQKQLSIPNMKGRSFKTKKNAGKDQPPADTPQADGRLMPDAAQEAEAAQEADTDRENSLQDIEEPKSETDPEPAAEQYAGADAAGKAPDKNKPGKEKTRKEKRPRRPLFKKKGKEFVFEGEEEKTAGAADEADEVQDSDGIQKILDGRNDDYVD
jgi:hypothetical protein